MRRLDQSVRGENDTTEVLCGMTHEYPLLLTAPTSRPDALRPPAPPPPTPVVRSPGSWRYVGVPRSRWRLAVSLLISAGIHAAILFGLRSRPPAVVHAKDDHLIAMTIAMPNLKDLEEPEPQVLDSPPEKLDPAVYAPSLMDAPQIPKPSDFVQELNFASLLPQPDLSEVKVFVIPQNIARVSKLADGKGNIFNLADLDRVPEPIMQPSPVFPPSMKHEASAARVVVQFIVDTDGRVIDPVVVESSNQGFDYASTSGVLKWRFRPGIRGGRKVNTRMSVPILFKLTDNLD